MKVGSKIVCIDSSIEPRMFREIYIAFQQWVKKDEIYTIREILHNNGIVDSLLLEELHNEPMDFPKTIGRVQEPSFRVTRFRELEEHELEESTVNTEKLVYEE